jgi:hypothetical protein
MVTTVTAIAVALALLAVDRYIRRHPAWGVSGHARFCVSIAYPMVVIATYFLAAVPTQTGWDWVFGLVWAVAALVSFATGFEALRRVLRRQRRASLSIETITQTAAV